MLAEDGFSIVMPELARLEQNYHGLTQRQAKETVLRYLLEQVDGIAPPLH